MTPYYYYSPSNRGFYVEGFHDEIPEDAIKLPEGEHEALMAKQGEGYNIVPSPIDGYPVAMPRPAPTYEELVALTKEARQRAYADPVNGSDALFAEVTRLMVMGEDTTELRAKAVARYEEIRVAHPWPEEPA